MVWITMTPNTDEEAKEYFIIKYFKLAGNVNIQWVQANRPDGTEEMILTPALDGYEEPTDEEREELDRLGSSNA